MSTPQATAVGQRGQQAPLRQSLPDAHIVPLPQSRQTTPSPITSGTGMPQATVDAAAHAPQQTRAPEPLVPGGLMQLVPAEQRLPKPEHVRHAEAGMGSPQATLPPEAQFAQQVPLAPPVQDVPEPQPPVPKPEHVRQMAPLASRTSGMRVPQGTLEGSAQPPQQVRSTPPPGLSTQAPLLHIVPVPLQSRHTAPAALRASGMGMPQPTLPAAPHAGQQLPSRHSLPAAQRVPSPVQAMLPMHVAGMSMPQSTIAGAMQSSVHVHDPATQLRPSVHGPLQAPPQPSGAPHIAPGAQLGMHSQSPVSGLHSSDAPGQVPGQKPPQPSGAPQAASAAQRGTQTHEPPMQRAGATHAGSQPQVSMQVPFWQISPRSQVTPKHGFGRQLPARQNSPAAQVTPSQAERGVQVRWQAPSSPQPAGQGVMSAQVPRAGSQY